MFAVLFVLSLTIFNAPGVVDGFNNLTEPSIAKSLLQRSFSITTIKRSPNSRPDTYDEYYSKNQGRAKISAVLYDYYYSTRDAKLLQHNGGSSRSSNCNPIDFPTFYGERLDFEHDPIKSFIEDGLKLFPKDQQHVVGLARLIPIIAKFADEMQFISSDTEELNYETQKFMLNINHGDPKGHMTFAVHYPSLHGARVDPASAVPARIIVMQKPDGVEEDIFAIDFTALKFINEEESDIGTGDDDRSSDLFALPLGRECSQSLDLRQPLIPSEYLVASFGASRTSQSKQTAVMPMNLFVAIDSRDETLMRVDRLANTVDEIKVIRTNLFDWAHNHHYLIVQGQKPKCLSMALSAGDKHPDTRNPIFGSDEFVYMGLARQNGAVMQVYEAKILNNPIWIDQPELIKLDAEHYRNRRFGYPTMPKDDFGLTSHHEIVVYVATDDGHSEPFPAYPRVTLIEFYTNSELVDQFSINEFEQALNVAQTGQKGSSLFSLAPCFIDEQSQQDKKSEEQLSYFKTIEILFELSAPPVGAYLWLNDADKRNEAVLNVFDFPPAMLNKMESSLVHNSSGSVHLLAKLETLPYIERLHELQYRTSSGVDQSKCEFLLYAKSPAECLSMLGRSLSYNNKEIYFDQAKSLCLVASKFDTIPRAPEFGEIFNVTYLDDVEMKIRYANFHSKNWRLAEQRQLSYKGEASLVASLKHYKRSQTADEDSQDYGQIERSSFAGINLDIGSKTYKIWRITHNDSSNTDKQNNTVSLDKCKAACLDNPRCRSFSYCKHPDKLDCLLTEANIENGNIQSQLEAKQIWKMAHNEKLQVNLTDGKQLDLIHDGKCELHRKTFIELFVIYPKLESKSIQFLNVTATSSREQCAELCFTRSLDVMTSLNDFNQDIWHKLTDETQTTATDDVARNIRQIRKDHRQKLRDFCNEFFYLDETISADELAKLAKYLNTKDDQPVVGGFCAIQAIGDKQMHPDKDEFNFITHGFDFSSLFEKRHDYILDSSLTSDEKAAFDAASKSQTLPDDKLQLIKAALKAKKNHRLALDGNKSPVECAAECFQQNVWPVCRSFDYIQQTTRSSLCYLNTANLSSPDAVAVDQVGNNPNIAQRFHYETRFKLLMFNQDVTAEIEIDSESGKTKPNKSGWVIFFDLVLICTGIFFGIRYAPRLVSRIEPALGLRRHSAPDVSSLVRDDIDSDRTEVDQKATPAYQLDL